MAAETEREFQHGFDSRRDGLIANEAQIALGIDIGQIRARRDDLVAQTETSQRGLDTSRGSQQMAQRPLQTGGLRPRCRISESASDGSAFGGIVRPGASAMQLNEIGNRAFTSSLDEMGQRNTVGFELRHPRRIGSEPSANHFGVPADAACLGVRAPFENQPRRSRPHGEAAAGLIKRPTRRGWISPAREHAQSLKRSQHTGVQRIVSTPRHDRIALAAFNRRDAPDNRDDTSRTRRHRGEARSLKIELLGNHQSDSGRPRCLPINSGLIHHRIEGVQAPFARAEDATDARGVNGA